MWSHSVACFGSSQVLVSRVMHRDFVALSQAVNTAQYEQFFTVRTRLRGSQRSEVLFCGGVLRVLEGQEKVLRMES